MSSCVPGMMCLPSGVPISFDIVFDCDMFQTPYTGLLRAVLLDPPNVSDVDEDASNREAVIRTANVGEAALKNIGISPKPRWGPSFFRLL